MINVAIVGMGNMGAYYLREMMKSDLCRPCAICDVNEEALKKLADEYNLPGFTDYKDIPDAVEADAVIINLPHYLHCESAVFFLERGIHVLVEKPMANTVEECDRMLAAAKKSGKKMAIGHLQRYFRANQAVKEVIDSEKLGKLCMFTEFRTADYFSPSRPRWFLNKKMAGGGIVMNYGAHALDKLFYVLGASDVKITSSVGNFKNDSEVEGHAQFMLQFPSGVSGTVTFSGYSSSGYDAIYYFTEGALKVTNTTQLYYTADGEWKKAEEVVDTRAAIAIQLEEFCHYINGEPATVADGEYGRAVIAAIEQVYAE